MNKYIEEKIKDLTLTRNMAYTFAGGYGVMSGAFLVAGVSCSNDKQFLPMIIYVIAAGYLARGGCNFYYRGQQVSKKIKILKQRYR